MENTEQDDKFFVVDGAKCMCDKGTIAATLKVTSHTKTIFNSVDSDKWAATEEDVQCKEGTSCFGSCKMKNNNPCTFAPVGQWLKPYEKVKILDKSAIIENSYLMCSVGGKITIKNHGQTAEINNTHVQKADARVMNVLNPFIDFEEFQADFDQNQYYV